MRLAQTIQILAVIAGLFSVLGVLLGIKGKWDESNAILRNLVTEIARIDKSNSQDHERMAARTDVLEGRINEHIARHRRL